MTSGLQIILTKSSEELASLIASYPVLDDALQSAVRSAAVVLLPSTGHAGAEVSYFPSDTPALLQLLQQELPEGVRVEAAVDEDAYQELALHGIVMTLATVACTSVVLPIVKDLLAKFIERKISKKETLKGATVRAKIIVAKTMTSCYTEISYEGPAAEFRKTLDRVDAKAGSDEIIYTPPTLIEVRRDEAQGSTSRSSSALEGLKSSSEQAPKHHTD